MDNLSLWKSLEKPPEAALKKITGGRMSGKTDINPQWRYLAITEQLGPCGVGWKYTIDKLWTEDGPEGVKMCFAMVSLYIKQKDIWSDAIPGTGGNMLIAKEKDGLRASDEGYKMAITDALSVCLKMVGVASAIYMGQWDGSKYTTDTVPIKTIPTTQLGDIFNKQPIVNTKSLPAHADCSNCSVERCDGAPEPCNKWVAKIVVPSIVPHVISPAQITRLHTIAAENKKPVSEKKSILNLYGFTSSKEITTDKYDEIIATISHKIGE